MKRPSVGLGVNMEQLILAFVGIVCVAISYRIGFSRGVDREQNRVISRRGVYPCTLEGAGRDNMGVNYPCRFLVTELEDLGNGYSRVSLDDVSGLASDFQKKQAYNIVGTIIPNKDVEWNDDLPPLLKE